ncbi:MAG: hypothetical protein FJ171_04290 [Gammaproteobacteria bacterium]|nr:hypothetical protein [Gammaproteobacteria bacterium]
MIGYVILGTNNIARARSFYDALLAEMGVTRMMEFGAPGLRGEGGEGFYAAYLRDLDGNKLDVYHYG